MLKDWRDPILTHESTLMDSKSSHAEIHEAYAIRVVQLTCHELIFSRLYESLYMTMLEFR